jgi:broad specificity phosphatase PhoE
MKLVFVRHGNTFNNNETSRQVGCSTDISLTEQGAEQIYNLKQHFITQNYHFDTCFCGPLKRHIACAKILNDKYIIKKELNEINYGLWENLTNIQIQSQWPTEYYSWHKEAKWAKNIFCGDQKSHIENLSRLIEDIAIKHKSSHNILIISSQGIIRYILYLTGAWNKIVETKSMQNYKVSPAHYCVIEKTDKTLKILSWNNSIDSTNS